MYKIRKLTVCVENEIKTFSVLIIQLFKRNYLYKMTFQS